jgi:hypothetical protein
MQADGTRRRAVHLDAHQDWRVGRDGQPLADAGRPAAR